MSTVVPTKRATGKFASDACLEFMEENCDKESNIIVKSDQEVALEFLVKDVVSERPSGKTIIEESHVKSKGGNAVVERTIQDVEGCSCLVGLLVYCVARYV